MTDFLCPECGAGRVRPVDHHGYKARYGVFPALAAEGTVTIPTCANCKEEFTGPAEHAQLEAALKLAYGKELQRRAIEALDRLTEQGLTQRDAEKLLDLSPGYLSKVRTEKMPSAVLVAALAGLAVRSDVRRSELEAFWREGTPRTPDTTFGAISEHGEVLLDSPTEVPKVAQAWGRR